MTEAEYAIERLTAWIRNFGDQKSKVFIEDLAMVLELAKSHVRDSSQDSTEKKMNAKRTWKDYLAERSEDEIREIARVAIAELINADLVRFREHDDDPEFGCEECLYWESCGDSLLGE